MLGSTQLLKKYKHSSGTAEIDYTVSAWNRMGVSTSSEISGYAFPDVDKRNITLEDRFLKSPLELVKLTELKRRKIIPTFLKVELYAVSLISLIAVIILSSSLFTRLPEIQVALWSSMLILGLIGVFAIIIFSLVIWK